jgi:hypothetical protein
MIYEEIFNLWEKQSIVIPVFVRIDDFISYKQRNHMNVFEYFSSIGIKVDVATIPYSFLRFSKPTQKIVSQFSRQISFHQHGFKHQNNSSSGISDEFPDSMPFAKIESSIRQGSQILKEHLGDQYCHFYTPPWNRVNGRLIQVLKSHRFELLSAGKQDLNKSNRFHPIKYLGVNIDPVLSYRPLRYKTFATIMKEIVYIGETSSYIGLVVHPNHMTKKEIKLLKRVFGILLQWKLFRFQNLENMLNIDRGVGHG